MKDLFKKYESINNDNNRRTIDFYIENGFAAPEIKWFATEKIHGCFLGNTKILLPDNTYKTISEIVKTKYNGDVLGCDSEGNLVPTKVTNWFENGIKDKWLKLSLQSYGNGRAGRIHSIQCTPDHRFFVNNQYVEASKLNLSDKIEFATSALELTFVQKQILIGKMLGDGSLSTSDFISFGHKEQHEEYLDFTLKSLGNLAGNRQKDQISGHGTVMKRGKTISSSTITELFKDWDKSIGYVPAIELTPIALAFWYMDDGSIALSNNQRPRASFATCGFNLEGCNNLVNALGKLGIKARIGGEKAEKRLRIQLTADSTELLFAYISTLVPSCMQYKLGPEFRISEGGVGLLNQAEASKKMQKSYAILTKVEELTENRQSYDIETETHNYYANRMHVHNCNFSAISDGVDIIYCQRSHVIGGDAQFMGHLNWVSQIEEKVKALAKRLGKIQVFFEYYGKGIVNKAAIPYRNDDEKAFIAYDVLLLEHNNFLEYPVNFEFLEQFGIPHVKVMAEGTFEELLQFNTDFKSPLAALNGIDTYAEGIVLKPFTDIRLNTGERVILKRISERFAENRSKAAQKQELSLDETQVQEIANAATDVRLGKVAAKFGILPDEKQKFAVLIQELANDIKEDLPHIELGFIKKQIPAVVKAYFGM